MCLSGDSGFSAPRGPGREREQEEKREQEEGREQDEESDERDAPTVSGDRALQALQAMENASAAMRMLATAVERAQDVVLITESEPVDLPGPRILYVNDAFEKMTGYSRDEVLGRTPRLLQGPESDRAALDRIRTALKQWKPVREELINYRKDGSKFWVELSMVPIADENGWYTHWVSIQRETTEQNVIRTQLADSEARLRTLTESIPQLLWTASPAGECEYVSQTCADFLGVEPKDCLGMGWGEFIHPRDRAETYALWRQAIETGGTFISEYRLRRRDGRYLWFLHRAAPRRGMNGQIVEWIGTSTDIAVQKQAEESLRQSEKLAVAGRLASTLSHEINNPLEGLTNLLYLIEGNESLDAAAREYLGMAQEQLRRVSEATTQSLRFHRQADRASARRISEIVDALLNANRPRMEARSIVVRRRYEGDTILQCLAGEMRQALGNVINNAVEALAPRGLLWVRVRRSLEWGHGFRLGVRVSIADNGPGIAEADLPRIFEPFFTTKGVTGTGLGLWITRGIVERHHGSICVRSCTRPGRSGTVVVLFFPYEPPSDLG